MTEFDPLNILIKGSAERQAYEMGRAASHDEAFTAITEAATTLNKRHDEVRRLPNAQPMAAFMKGMSPHAIYCFAFDDARKILRRAVMRVSQDD